MAQKTLEILFGSPLRVRLLGFFIQNQDTTFSLDDLKKRLKIKQTTSLKQELVRLASIRLLKIKGGGKKRGYSISPSFYFYPELKSIFAKSPLNLKEPVMKLAKKLGKGVRLLLISGFFLNEPKSVADLLLVGRGLKEGRIKSAIEDLEAEVGRVLTYAIFSDTEFTYRYNMSDRFLLSILEGPREIVINHLLQRISSTEK